MPRILIADDDTDLRTTLRELLSDEGYDVNEAESGEAVLTALNNGASDRPSLVIMDVRMPGKSGIDVLRELRGSLGSQLPVLVMTAFGGSNVAIEAIQLGAYDYITKPFDLEDMLATVKRYFDWQELNDQVIELSSRLTGGEPEAFIGNSPAMQQVYKTIGRVARSDATVMISGETGTGKELVATILHRSSGYARGPLVKVNCAALPETLLESELFGHEKGAFTGAIAQRKGRFEMANRGTIFLDEIGEMTLSTQKKLLRVLQEREFERVGGSITVKVDTRVISATNKHLPTEIDEGRFREDLYYRLNVISIHLPPLRERRDDVPLLVDHFLHKHRYTAGSDPARISQGALQQLMDYDWPGNVRELENVIERAVILAQGTVITERHIDFTGASMRQVINVPQSLREGKSLDDLIQTVERQAIAEALTQSDGNQVAAAAMLGIGEPDLAKRIKRFGL
jgi:two-component system, NtrC family, response regulator AtoC